MAELTKYCVSGCEIGKCKLAPFGQLIVAATQLAAEVGATEAQTQAIVDAHGTMVARCTDYATSDALDQIQQDNPDLSLK